MKLVVGNFKMNLDFYEIEEYINYFKDKNYSNVLFAPSSIYLTKFTENSLNCAAQDVSSYENGAYTGDISASQLKSIGVSYSIVGHSERRKYYQDDLFVNKKIIHLLEQGINPILCVGETKEERESNQTINIIENEINKAFDNIKSEYLKEIIIAYEPIWSIGTGLVPSNNEIEEVILHIKNYIKKNYSLSSKVLYGGSVNNNCINKLEEINSLDGYLVGGCSLKYMEFDKLINSIK